MKRFKKTSKSSRKRVSPLKSKFYKFNFKKSASSLLKNVKPSRQQIKNKNKVFKASKRCKRTAGFCGIAGKPRLPKSNFELPNKVIESTLKNDIITEKPISKMRIGGISISRIESSRATIIFNEGYAKDFKGSKTNSVVKNGKRYRTSTSKSERDYVNNPNTRKPTSVKNIVYIDGKFKYQWQFKNSGKSGKYGK